jgi:hypothetical protein
LSEIRRDTPDGLAFSAREARSFGSELNPVLDLPMTIDASPGLTPEELSSLVDLAMLTPSPKIPALHLTRLMVLGYVQLTADGPLVTGDGLIRITEDV